MGKRPSIVHPPHPRRRPRLFSLAQRHPIIGRQMGLGQAAVADGESSATRAFRRAGKSLLSRKGVRRLCGAGGVDGGGDGSGCDNSRRPFRGSDGPVVALVASPAASAPSQKSVGRQRRLEQRRRRHLDRGPDERPALCLSRSLRRDDDDDAAPRSPLRRPAIRLAARPLRREKMPRARLRTPRRRWEGVRPPKGVFARGQRSVRPSFPGRGRILLRSIRAHYQLLCQQPRR
mmetsp:Transcript_15947/g.31237  ORF Transcript_15947/g.31237 Transcript_15947/m.31237 type:complete len:232 (+) Transcript_15947:486-1181(+)